MGLEELDHDVFLLVLRHYSSERSIILKRLRLVSQKLKALSDLEFFRHVTVGDDNEDRIDATNYYIDRFADPQDFLRKTARVLAVASFEGDDASDCLNTHRLCDVIQQVHSLTTFSWAAHTRIPEDVLDTFQRRWPESRLGLITKEINIRALSSPQLYHLDISVPREGIQYGNFGASGTFGRGERCWLKTLSYFNRLTRVVLQCRALRILSIDIHRDPRIQYHGLGPEDRGELNLHLSEGDRLPPLHEFALKSSLYFADENHCLRLLEALDWTRLRRLAVPPVLSRSLDQTVATAKPNLYQLECLYTDDRYRSYCNAYHIQDYYIQYGSVLQSIRSIGGLNELAISFCNTKHELLWHDISIRHGNYLQRLSDAVPYWFFLAESLEWIHTLIQYFPNLEYLAFKVSLECREDIYHWPITFTQHRYYFSTLTTLQISILLRNYATRDDHLIRNPKPLACRLIAELWDGFDFSDHSSRLESMTLLIWQQEISQLCVKRVMVADYIPHNSPESRFRFKDCRREPYTDTYGDDIFI